MNKDTQEPPSLGQGAAHLQGESLSTASSPSWQRLRTAGLALFLYFLLIDAAVETFLSGAPVRWWVALVVVTYLGGSAVLWWRGHSLWQRAGWATTITISFFILTGLLVFTVWMPSGLTQGLTLLSLSTSALLSLVTAAAIVLAGQVLLQLRYPHPALKWAVGVLVAYGVIAFLWAVFAGTAYPALFHGESFWSWLPSRLQGASVGTLVIVPLAIAVELANILRRLGEAEGGKWRLQQTVALGMSVVMAISGLRIPASSGDTARPAGQTAGLALPSGAELAKDAGLTLQPPQPVPGRPDDLTAHFAEISRRIPKVRYDLAVRAQSLGPSVDPTFLFVRDHIRFEAYPGVLRGAVGTYVTRAGNAFDRSLLLAELLKRKGMHTRFALGKLPRPQAERLFARIFDPAPPLEADAASTAPASRSPEAEAFEARLRARAARDYAMIRKALGNTLPAQASPSREEVLRELEGHVWVQAEVNGQWIDLDSAFLDATSGHTYATAERTVEVLPKEQYQWVTIRVISETLASGSLKTDTALEFSTAAEELLDRQIFLTHQSGGGDGLAGAIAGGAMGNDTWTPMLWVDGETHTGKPIAFREDQKPGERGQPPRGGLGALFGSGGALATSSQFVAEWLEFELTFPDGRREVTRRALADRAGMAWRQEGKFAAAALHPLPRDADGLLPPRALHNIWLSAGLHNLSQYVDALQLLAYWTKDIAKQSADTTESPSMTQDATASLTFGQQVWPLALMNFASLVQSDHVTLPALNDSPAYRFYPDSPRIFIVSVGQSAQGFYIQYDLRRDLLRGLARNISDEAGIAERKIWFGVLQGALEHEMVAQHTFAGGGDISAVTSTSSLLTDEGTIVLQPGDPSGTELVTDRETAARMAHALAGKAILVVPRSVLQEKASGWWQISSQGADTRAVLGYDTNAAMGELPPFRPGWGWRPYGWAPGRPLPPGMSEPPPLAPAGSGPIEQIGPLLPDGTQNPQSRCAGGNEYTGTTSCISVPASTVPATTMTPLFVRVVVGVGLAVAVALVGYAIGTYAF